MSKLQNGGNAVLVQTASEVSQVEQDGGGQLTHDQREGELALCGQAHL